MGDQKKSAAEDLTLHSRVKLARNGSVARPGTASGFTLIELIIVMALLTVTIGLAAPRLASFFRGRALESEARRFVALTRFAQDRAGSEGVPIRVWIDSRSGLVGLESDPAYQQSSTADNEIQIDGAIQLEVASSPEITAKGRLPGSATGAASKYSQLPAIRFLPDGTIDPESPERVVFQDAEGHVISVTRSLNRLTYEIPGR